MLEPSITLFVISHLPVENNLRGILAGLDDQSIRDSEKYLPPLREALEGWRFEAVLSSPLRRSLETVALCFDPAETPLRVDQRLLPVDYGRFHGRLKRDVGPLYPEFVDRPFPEGESFSQVARRNEAFLTEILPEYDGKEVALMAHEGSDSILAHLCDGESLEERFRVANEERLKRLMAGVDLVTLYRRPPTGPFVFSRPAPGR